MTKEEILEMTGMKVGLCDAKGTDWTGTYEIEVSEGAFLCGYETEEKAIQGGFFYGLHKGIPDRLKEKLWKTVLSYPLPRKT
jgi:hypothetical protein